MVLFNLKRKIDYILHSSGNEKEYLLHKIDQYYDQVKARKPPTQVIECDFKKKEIVRFFEYLTEEDLGKNF